MEDKFNFKELIKQAKEIDDGVESIRDKIINCDIGNGDATSALSILDNNISEIEGVLDFMCSDLRQEVEEIVRRNSEIRDFIVDLDSKIEKLEACAREFKSPQNMLETPVSGRRYHHRNMK
ncbi:uncharacterized protein [Halyomorpha halys]|uniref:uncharacterized protein n=1 Tax=Halyomorpha halys TaxID=286706 RepID=UPI0006D52715|nr:uncharacterized protein LOC106684225 [Halyomorpha halys]